MGGPGPRARGAALSVDADQLLLTRFNLELAGGGGRGTDPAWLAERIALFERLCAPSVAAQRGPRRRWLLFVDARTPPEALERVRAAAAPAGGELLPVAGPLPVVALRRRVAAALGPAARALLVTTRLDNDDALAPGHLDVVLAAARAAAEAGREEFLNPRSGWQLAAGRVYATSDPSGPFLSLVERRRGDRDPLTAFGVPHRRAREVLAVRQLRGQRLWVQGVHGANLVNALDGVRVDGAALAREVPVLAPLVAPRPAGAASELGYRADQAASLARWAALRARRRLLRAMRRGR